MGSKLGLILSLGFLLVTYLFGLDIILLHITYSNVEAVASSASTYFSRNGGITCLEYVKTYVAKELGGKGTVVLVDQSSKVGELFTFKVDYLYSPIVMNKTTIKISVKRSSYIGQYDSYI
ncbi:MAG: hypothetical protein RSA91_05295 [Bacilli bacterium]